MDTTNQPLPTNHYYHFSNCINVGDVIDTHTWDFNNYFKTKSDLQWTHLAGNHKRYIDMYSEIIKSSQTRGVQADTLQATIDGLIFIDEYVGLTRELIFEQIRLTVNQNLPSRQRCIWLASTSLLEDGWIDYWRTFLKDRKNLGLYVVELLDCEPFIAFEGHIRREAEPFETTLKRAEAYWQGEPSKTTMKEFLYEGKFRVVNKISF